MRRGNHLSNKVRINERGDQAEFHTARLAREDQRSSYASVAFPFDSRHLTLSDLHLKRSVETNGPFRILPGNRVVTRFQINMKLASIIGLKRLGYLAVLFYFKDGICQWP